MVSNLLTAAQLLVMKLPFKPRQAPDRSEDLLLPLLKCRVGERNEGSSLGFRHPRAFVSFFPLKPQAVTRDRT